jgi:hypothetical protein
VRQRTRVPSPREGARHSHATKASFWTKRSSHAPAPRRTANPHHWTYIAAASGVDYVDERFQERAKWAMGYRALERLELRIEDARVEAVAHVSERGVIEKNTNTGATASPARNLE